MRTIYLCCPLKFSQCFQVLCITQYEKKNLQLDKIQFEHDDLPQRSGNKILKRQNSQENHIPRVFSFNEYDQIEMQWN